MLLRGQKDLLSSGWGDEEASEVRVLAERD